MSNLANIQKMYYCDKKLSNNSTCPNIATRQVSLKFKGNIDNTTVEHGHRCEIHSNCSTGRKEVVRSEPFDQEFALTLINQFLRSVIGKNIVSKFHSAKQLRVKYVVKNTGGIMCLQEITQKYKFVYYHQITEVL